MRRTNDGRGGCDQPVLCRNMPIDMRKRQNTACTCSHVRPVAILVVSLSLSLGLGAVSLSLLFSRCFACSEFILCGKRLCREPGGGRVTPSRAFRWSKRGPLERAIRVYKYRCMCMYVFSGACGRVDVYICCLEMVINSGFGSFIFSAESSRNARPRSKPHFQKLLFLCLTIKNFFIQ